MATLLRVSTVVLALFVSSRGEGSEEVAGPESVSVASTTAGGSCTNDRWVEAYSPERCSLNGDAAIVSCVGKIGEECGMRMEGTWKVGYGRQSMGIKAAPGPGVVTTFYSSNNGGLYDKTCTKPWVELDFEIMGNQAGPTSRVWTNMLRGTCEENWQWITLPFDVTKDYHTYSFDITPTTVSWLVDGVSYRTKDIRYLNDVKESAAQTRFQEFVSVWGKSSSEEGEGIPAFRNALGFLDQNPNSFPLTAGFKRSPGSSPAPAPAPTPVSGPAPAPSSGCSSGVAVWGDCSDRKCCEGSAKCYAKDTHYAQCRPSCAEGIHWEEPEEFRTPWSCSVLSASMRR